MKRILILDNYDSFTYNLVHYVEAILNERVDVFRNNKISIEAIDSYSHIILSPGPGLPKDAGIMPQLLKKYTATKKILGICLGHQAIAECFGGSLYNLEKVYHGVSSTVTINNSDKLFVGLPNKIDVGRYHSWAVNKGDLPVCLSILANDENDVVMAFKHNTLAITGVQFHPESVLTPHGREIMMNWLKD